jgi:hypothetical protein
MHLVDDAEEEHGLAAHDAGLAGADVQEHSADQHRNDDALHVQGLVVMWRRWQQRRHGGGG